MTLADWATLSGIASSQLGRDVTRAVDRARLSPKSPLALVAILESIRQPRALQDPKSVARKAMPSTLDHLHFGFLIAAEEDTLVEIMFLVSRTLALTLADTRELGILSGTLKDWKQVVILGLSETISKDIRLVFGQIFAYFETLGLRDIWADYRKKSLEGTFALVIQ